MNGRTRILFGALSFAAIAIAWVTRPEPDLLARSIRLTPDETTFDLPVWSSNDSLRWETRSFPNEPSYEELNLRTGVRTRCKPQSIGRGVVGPRLSGEKLRLAEYMMNGGEPPCQIADDRENSLVLISGMKDYFLAAAKDSRTGRWLICNGWGSGSVDLSTFSQNQKAIEYYGPSLDPSHSCYVGVRRDDPVVLIRESEFFSHFMIPDEKDRTEPLCAIGIQNGPPEPVTARIQSPERSQIGDAALSPEGTRMAWLLYRWDYPSKAVYWLAERIPAIRPNLRFLVDLAISRPDGSDWRGIATMEYHPPMRTGVSPVTCSYCPDLLMWRPDNHYVSFNYKGAVWMTKVD